MQTPLEDVKLVPRVILRDGGQFYVSDANAPRAQVGLSSRITGRNLLICIAMVIAMSMCYGTLGQYLGRTVPSSLARGPGAQRLWAFTPTIAGPLRPIQTSAPRSYHDPRPRQLPLFAEGPEPATPSEVKPAAPSVQEPPKLSWWKRPFRRWITQPPVLPVSLPLTVLRMSTMSYVGADYYLLPFTARRLFGTSRTFYFMVDSGLTGTLLTTAAVEYLMPVPLQETVQGLAGAGNIQADLVFLDGLKLNGTIPCRSCVAAVVDFFQAPMGIKKGIEIVGMVGMEFLEQYDLVLDPFTRECTVYTPEQEQLDTTQRRMTLQGCELPGNLIGAMLQGYRYWDEEGAEGESRIGEAAPPILGLIDTGATYSIINWKAANLLGIFEGDPRLSKESTVNMMGVEGKRSKMPLIRMKMDLAGFVSDINPIKVEDESGDVWLMDGMKIDPSATVTFDFNSTVGIGDINFANLMRKKEIGPYGGPAAIIGQDLLMQKRYRISGSKRTLDFDLDYNPTLEQEQEQEQEQEEGGGGVGR